MRKQRNVADLNQVKESAEDQRRSLEQQKEELQELLKVREFRNFVWRWLGYGRLFKTSFTGNSETFFFEGQRHIATKLLAEVVNADPDALLLMMKESKGEINV